MFVLLFVLFCFPILHPVKYLFYLSIHYLIFLKWFCLWQGFSYLYFTISFLTHIPTNFFPTSLGKEGSKEGSEHMSEFLAVSQSQPTTSKMKRNKWIQWQTTLITRSQKFLCCYWIHLDLKPGREMAKLIEQKITWDKLTLCYCCYKQEAHRTWTALPSS